MPTLPCFTRRLLVAFLLLIVSPPCWGEEPDSRAKIRVACVGDSIKIPILHIVSENDRVVPPAENTYLVKERLEWLGGSMRIISVTEGTAESHGHHFDHPDPKKVVEFIVRHTAPTRAQPENKAASPNATR